jgi:hypothetical protein
MTSCTQPIWIVIIESRKGDRFTSKVAASTLPEILSSYNEDGISRIVKVEKTEEEVTYRYDEGSK